MRAFAVTGPCRHQQSTPMLDDPLPVVLDPARVAAVAATGLMDTPPEVGFDRLTRLAALLLDAPVAAISLIGEDRVFLKSALGFQEPLATTRVAPLSHSYCKHTIAARAAVVVQNAPEDPLFKEHPATKDLGVVAYAGVPLITGTHAIGTLCVVDGKPRQWTERDLEILSELATSVLTEVELRKKVGELTDARAVFSAVANSAQDAIITTDSDGVIVFWNGAATRIFGYEPQEIIGRSLTTLIPVRLHAEYREFGNRQHVGKTVEVPRVTKDGTEVFVELSLSTWTSAGRVFLTGILRDVTERNKQALRLRQTEEYLSLTVDNAPIGMALVAVDGRFTRVNKALCEIVGYSADELITKTFQQLTHPDDLEADLELLRQLMYGDIARYKLAKRYIHASGRLVDIMLHVSIVRGPHGEPSHFIVQIEDVTAIKAAEAALAQKTTILESVLTQMNEGVMVVDSISRVVLKNPAAERVLGPGPINYDPANSAYLLSPDGKHPYLWDELAHVRALQGERVDQEEVFYRGRPGRPGRWHSVTAAPLEGPNGKVWGAVVVGRDITRLKTQTAMIQLLQGVATAANQASSVHEALRQVLALVCEFTSRAVGHVYLARGNELEPTGIWWVRPGASFEAFRDFTSRVRLVAGLGLPGRVLEKGLAVHVENAPSEPGFLRTRPGVELGLGGGFAFPVVVGKEVVAVIECYSDRPEKADLGLLEVMMHIGEQIGRVVERERHAEAVRNLSLTDELTGLYNRRGFTTLVEPQLRAAARQKKGALILFADMDGLKRINDELGHEAGDEAIRSMAAVLRSTFRDSDILARLGGDEFVAFLPDADDIATPERRLQEGLSLENVRAGRPFVVAASVGAVRFEPATVETLDELLQRADSQMYEQKRRRRALRDSVRPHARLG